MTRAQSHNELDANARPSARSKQISIADVKSELKDGMSIMFGGFMGVGTPPMLIQAILDSGVRELTLIGNDTSKPGIGVSLLIAERRVKKVITSHIGLNPETGRQMFAGVLDVELVPQGTLAERIRCGGAGLGGFLTPTGIGTVVEEGKLKQTLDGVDYIVERALRADLAILLAHRADAVGNLIYQRAARNFNPVIALAADRVIAQVDDLGPIGSLDPEQVMTPGILIDAMVVTECH